MGLKEDKLIEDVAKRIYFEYVDMQGYPNGLPTWSEMTDERRKEELRAMARGAIEVVRYFDARDTE